MKRNYLPCVTAWSVLELQLTELPRFRPRRGLFLFLCLVLMTFACSPQADTSGVDTGSPDRAEATAAFLLGEDAFKTPFATSAFAPTVELPLPAQRFSGLLTLDTAGGSGQVNVLVDRYGIADDEGLLLTSLPPFAFRYVSDGDAIIPVEREPQLSSHPYWEIILEPGKIWSEKSDDGWSRASLPFALKEKNQNCIHNGLMTFLYQADGSISRVAWQIASETCLYFKADMWGVTGARYEPQAVPGHEKIAAGYRDEYHRRLPVKPVHALKNEYPGIDPAAFLPPGIEDTSVYGLVINGVHYRGDCPTRYGSHPFCDTLDLPSYSLAKSVVAGLGYMLLTRKWPEFAAMKVEDLVPECALDDQRWQGVTMNHLVNMRTGLYQSAEFDSDENNAAMDDFFLALSHRQKVRFSCETWPKKAAAGKKAVYHTTDTYLLGVAMSNFLKAKRGRYSDIYTFVYDHAFRDLGLSPLGRWTQRTYDERAQAFTGYGLVFHADDIVKIAASLNSDSSLTRLLKGADLDAAMFRGRGHDIDFKTPEVEYAYNNGFWGVKAPEALNCRDETWMSFMSGYGGIIVAMLPGGGVYYYFSDSGQYMFKKAAAEANKALNYCEES